MISALKNFSVFCLLITLGIVTSLCAMDADSGTNNFDADVNNHQNSGDDIDDNDASLNIHNDTNDDDIKQLTCLMKQWTLQEQKISEDDSEFAAFIVPIVFTKHDDPAIIANLSQQQKKDFAYRLIEVINKIGDINIWTASLFFETNQKLQNNQSLTFEIKQSIEQNLKDIFDKTGLDKSVIKAIRMEVLKTWSPRFKAMSKQDQMQVSTYGLNCALLDIFECPPNIAQKALMAVMHYDDPCRVYKDAGVYCLVGVICYGATTLLILTIIMGTGNFLPQISCEYASLCLLIPAYFVARNIYVHQQKQMI